MRNDQFEQTRTQILSANLDAIFFYGVRWKKSGWDGFVIRMVELLYNRRLPKCPIKCRLKREPSVFRTCIPGQTPPCSGVAFSRDKNTLGLLLRRCIVQPLCYVIKRDINYSMSQNWISHPRRQCRIWCTSSELNQGKRWSKHKISL